MESWAFGPHPLASPSIITTNAPVLLWNTTIAFTGDAAMIAYRCNVTSTTAAAPWSTHAVYVNVLPTWRGFAAYEGPGLVPDTTYAWTAEERDIVHGDGSRGANKWRTVAVGGFATSSTLLPARLEAAAVMSHANVSAIWNTSWRSIFNRAAPSGFQPTSVSGGYGGVDVEFPRDAAGQLIGLTQLAATSVGKQAAKLFAAVEHRLRFLFEQMARQFIPGKSFASYAPHVAYSNKNRSQFMSFDRRDQTDDTMYLAVTWCRYVNASGDPNAMESDFYALMSNWTNHYLSVGARSLGFGGTPSAPKIGGGVLYWNSSLKLLWNANLEHSRDGSYWSTYDALTQSFTIESLRCLADASERVGAPSAETKRWRTLHAAARDGLNGALKHSVFEGEDIYAELRGHPNEFKEDKSEVGFSPLLWGMSWVNVATLVLGLSAYSYHGGVESRFPIEELTLDVERMDNTFRAYARVGSFQWINEDVALSAMMPTTHANSSSFIDPPPPRTTSAFPPPTQCAAPLAGLASLAVAAGSNLCDPKEGGTSCASVTSGAGCCHACATTFSTTCAAWFFNGETKECDGHGCCFLKKNVVNDTVTPPTPLFLGGYGPHPAWCAGWEEGGKPCVDASNEVIGKGLGWEIGWRAYRKDWTRLIVLHRWLGAAAHVEQTSLFGEHYDYDCTKRGERDGFEPMNKTNPKGEGCWGDPGNGVQIGWFVWGEALARSAAGLAAV